MNIIATMTSKGQITLPSYVRKIAKLKTGDKLYFTVEQKGEDIVIFPKKLKTLDQLQGIFKKPANVGKIEDLSWV